MGYFPTELAKASDASKAHNAPAARNAKIEIRERVFNAFRLVGPVHVFDAFAGGGEMYRAVWNNAASYVGCDKERQRDERTMFCADNRRVMRSIDLRAFNVFDLDAFGSPFEQATILAARRVLKPGELVGLVLTDGSSLTMKMGALPNAMMALTNIRSHMAGFMRWRDDILGQALLSICKHMNAKIAHRWEAQGKTRAMVRYVGLVLEGL